MSELYRMRLSRHLKKMMKYMQYVFNDHFVIVCVFLLGGLGFYYSEFLKNLPEEFVWGRPLVLLIWLAILFIGKLATLTQEADKVFILPKEAEMPGYFKRALSYSAILPAVSIFLISGMTMPLVVVTTRETFVSFIYYLLMLLLLKFTHLKWQEFDLYQIPGNKSQQWQLIWLLGSAAAIAASLYVVPLAGLIVAIILCGMLGYFLPKLKAGISLDWEKMIKKENNRMYQIYRFINLFTDVPEITGSVKRRKAFDPLLNKIKKENKNTYLYLYARSFLRGSEYSGLFLRLLGLGGVILYFSNDFIMSLGAAIVFLYLMGFQMIPIYSQFDYMVMTQLYPAPATQRKQAVSFLLMVLLFTAAAIFSILTLIALPNKPEGLLVVAALVVEVIVFTKLYVPQRLKKMEG
ncbi:ABC transporter permease [Enterococcus sp. BWT-B8]|uniref:ABC transporter permease n=1 Tax=Enterococcus sp. BWT-B8 TaxID=2885157 RepID=UPI001E519947|nr:ABC transporter permease [Enterococcus sp. BWT-B8]MCB5952787.1 ABC transporter permease [Enterococcus sp. BWT-B8]